MLLALFLPCSPILGVLLAFNTKQKETAAPKSNKTNAESKQVKKTWWLSKGDKIRTKSVEVCSLLGVQPSHDSHGIKNEPPGGEIGYVRETSMITYSTLQKKICYFNFFYLFILKHVAFSGPFGFLFGKKSKSDVPVRAVSLSQDIAIQRAALESKGLEDSWFTNTPLHKAQNPVGSLAALNGYVLSTAGCSLVVYNTTSLSANGFTIVGTKLFHPDCNNKLHNGLLSAHERVSGGTHDRPIAGFPGVRVFSTVATGLIRRKGSHHGHQNILLVAFNSPGFERKVQIWC